MMKQINGIPIEMEYRNVKNINLYIRPPNGSILVTAPRTVSKKRILAFVSEKMEWIEKSRARMLSHQEQEKKRSNQSITNEQIARLRKGMEEYIAKWEPVMGVHASAWTIRDMKTRWGSCTVRTGRIRINKQLALFPEIYLEYIIVHELCHLLEASHNERFKRLMTSFLPDWKERRSNLKRLTT